MKATGRLRTADDFKLVMSKGLKARSRHLAVTYLLNGVGETRFGVNVPERTSKSAVRRNRLKRVVREGFRLVSEKIAPGFDIVFAVLRDPVRKDGEVIRWELEDLMKKCGLWQEGE